MVSHKFPIKVAVMKTVHNKTETNEPQQITTIRKEYHLRQS